ncbi:MAG: ribosomal protein S18 acetylase RimI-like enzyme [Verrucomicrobiales bacterium]|jgi:ribosomal protein S18 acetylase RimI-like enzyme
MSIGEPVRFRSATAADVDAICDLWEASGLGGGRSVHEHEIQERLLAEDDLFVVGERMNRDALTAVAMGCYDNHRGWLKRVAIHPSEQGSGLGRRLIVELESRFLAAGITKLRLAVWDHNDGGAAFWRELGYTELPEIRYFTKDL